MREPLYLEADWKRDDAELDRMFELQDLGMKEDGFQKVEIAGKETIVKVENVPVVTLIVIAEELRKYGSRVEFETSLKGVVEHLSGKARFEHDGEGLLVVVVEVDAGHFPGSLLIGGIRQLIEEAAEDVRMNCGKGDL